MKIKNITNLKKAWKERSSITSDYGNLTLISTVNNSISICLIYEKQGEYFKISVFDKDITLTDETVENYNELKKKYKNIIKDIKKGNL